MTRSLRILPPAEKDLRDAFLWYEERSAGLGFRFFQAVDECFDTIGRNPFQYAEVHKGIRRALLRRFPFGIFYIVEATSVAILACFHARRDPGRLRHRIAE